MPRDPARSDDEHESLTGERRRNAQLVNGLRFAGISAFFLLFAVLGYGLGRPSWQGNIAQFGLYWVASALLFVLARRVPGAIRLVGFAVPLLDMPLVYLLQRGTFAVSRDPLAIAGYSLGFFLFLLLLGSLTLERWVTVLGAVSASLCEGKLQLDAGAEPGAIVSSFILIGLGALTSAYASTRLTALLDRALDRLEQEQHALAALREADRSSRMLIERSPEPLAVHTQGQVVYANEAFLEYLGYPLGALQQLGLDAIVHSDDWLAFLPPVEGGLGEAHRDARLKRANGSGVVAEVTALPVVFYGRESILVVLRDVTERRQMQAQLVETIERLQEREAEAARLAQSEREKAARLEVALAELRLSEDSRLRVEKLAMVGQLAASIGHDLRNPLSAIGMASHLLTERLRERDTGDASATRFLAVIEREVQACTRIINDLLDFARERPLRLGPCELPALTQEVFSLIEHAPQVQLLNRIPADFPPIRVDRDLFRQVLLNLVQNAVEALPATPAGRVEVSAWRLEDEVEISIRDNGAGIADEVRRKIFEPLFTTKPKGTGLGLAIVQTLVKRHGGRIEVKSELGRGTAFTLRLPAIIALARQTKSPATGLHRTTPVPS